MANRSTYLVCTGSFPSQGSLKATQDQSAASRNVFWNPYNYAYMLRKFADVQLCLRIEIKVIAKPVSAPDGVSIGRDPIG